MIRQHISYSQKRNFSKSQDRVVAEDRAANPCRRRQVVEETYSLVIPTMEQFRSEIQQSIDKNFDPQLPFINSFKGQVTEVNYFLRVLIHYNCSGILGTDIIVQTPI